MISLSKWVSAVYILMIDYSSKSFGNRSISSSIELFLYSVSLYFRRFSRSFSLFDTFYAVSLSRLWFNIATMFSTSLFDLLVLHLCEIKLRNNLFYDSFDLSLIILTKDYLSFSSWNFTFSFFICLPFILYTYLL